MEARPDIREVQLSWLATLALQHAKSCAIQHYVVLPQHAQELATSAKRHLSTSSSRMLQASLFCVSFTLRSAIVCLMVSVPIKLSRRCMSSTGCSTATAWRLCVTMNLQV